MTSPNQITPAQLMRRIGLPDAPVIIDTMRDLSGQKVVVICHKGHKFSQGSAAISRDHGIAAETLEGGNVGWNAAGGPMVPMSKIPPRNPQGRTVWVTRLRPKIDRIACPWLIRRFVDATSEFMFVAPEWVRGAADRYNATPFDVPDVAFSHVGARCTFDAMLDAFDLRTDALDLMAQVIRAADTGANDNPQAAGLLAISVGLSRMYRDDHTQLDAAMPIYDALYRWARDGSGETHASFEGVA